MAILRKTDERVAIELGREDPKWCQKNICAPCLYKVDDEPPLKFKFLAAMDGNNSLKLVDSTYRAGTVRMDSRTTESPCWINPEGVDIFKDEVTKVRPILSFRYMILTVYCLFSRIHEHHDLEPVNLTSNPPWPQKIFQTWHPKKRPG